MWKKHIAKDLGWLVLVPQWLRVERNMHDI